jgi:hypothetical protein
MQRAGDVRRRNDDRERLGVLALGPSGLERTGVFPRLRDAVFDLGRLVIFSIIVRAIVSLSRWNAIRALVCAL